MHVLVLDERHLDVELGELGLAVGAEVFVAEAAGNLEIAVEAGRPSGVACRAGAIGAARRNGPHGRGWGPGSRAAPSGVLRPRIGVSTSRKLCSDMTLPHELRERWRRMKISCIVGPAEVEVAILEAQLFVGLGAVHLERRRRRGVVDHQVGRPRTSIAPVLSLGFSLPGSRGATVPLMPTTYSLRSSLRAACNSAPASGSKTTWVRP